MASKHNADRLIIRECPEGTQWYSTQNLNNLHAYAKTIGVKLNGTVSYVIDKATGESSRIWKMEITARPLVLEEVSDETEL